MCISDGPWSCHSFALELRVVARRSRGEDINSLLVVLGQTEFLESVIYVASGAVDSSQRLMFRRAVPGVVGQIFIELKLGGRIKLLFMKVDFRNLMKRRISPRNQGRLDRMLNRIKLELNLKVERPIFFSQGSGQSLAQVVRIALIGGRERFALGNAVFDSPISETVGNSAEP